MRPEKDKDTTFILNHFKKTIYLKTEKSYQPMENIGRFLSVQNVRKFFATLKQVDP